MISFCFVLSRVRVLSCQPRAYTMTVYPRVQYPIDLLGADASARLEAVFDSALPHRAQQLCVARRGACIAGTQSTRAAAVEFGPVFCKFW